MSFFILKEGLRNLPILKITNTGVCYGTAMTIRIKTRLALQTEEAVVIQQWNQGLTTPTPAYKSGRTAAQTGLEIEMSFWVR